MRRSNWSSSKGSKLCSEHFRESDYQNRPGTNVKLLKLDAVPSKFCFPASESKDISSKLPEKVDIDIDDLPSMSSESESKTFVNQVTPTLVMNQPSSPSEWESKLCVHKATQTAPRKQITESQISSLRRKVKTLKQKLRRQDLKISLMKDVIKEISKSGQSTENQDADLINYFESSP